MPPHRFVRTLCAKLRIDCFIFVMIYRIISTVPFSLVLINPFHATGLFLYLLKTSEDLCFSDLFKGNRKGPVA